MHVSHDETTPLVTHDPFLCIQPPVEALQFARILDDTAKTPSMSDLEKRIHEVLSIVPGRTSEEANVVLHDNDFNVETAVSALLDNDLGLGTVGFWNGNGVAQTKEGAGVEAERLGKEEDQVFILISYQQTVAHRLRNPSANNPPPLHPPPPPPPLSPPHSLPLTIYMYPNPLPLPSPSPYPHPLPLPSPSPYPYSLPPSPYPIPLSPSTPSPYPHPLPLPCSPYPHPLPLPSPHPAPPLYPHPPPPPPLPIPFILLLLPPPQGEWTTTAIGKGRRRRVKQTQTSSLLLETQSHLQTSPPDLPEAQTELVRV